jgi:hypothetical protein
VNVAYQTNFETTGDWKFDGSDGGITTCMDYNILGGYEILDYDDSVSLYVKDLIPHTSMTISFDFARIDSWDGETANVFIDDELVFSQAMSYSDGDTDYCGGSWYDNIVPMSFTIDHYAQGVEIVVETSLDQTGDDESWGLANFKITTSMADDCTELIYASDFTSDLQDGWIIDGATLDNVTECDGDILLGGYNNFAAGTTASKVLDLEKSGNGVIVAFTFMKIDSWDNEHGQLYANDVLVWNEELSYSNGDELCGVSGNSWYEERIIREIDLGVIDQDTLTLTWTTNLNSDGSDESWGLSDVDVYKYEPCDQIVYDSDFALEGDDGWLFVGSDGGTSTCDAEVLLGGYEILDYDDMASRLVELPVHTSIQVDFTFVKIDSWDGEYAYFYLDGTTLWEESLDTSSGSHVCGADVSSWLEDYHEKSFTVDHFSPFAWLSWQASIDQSGDDESWGLLDVKVTTFYNPLYTIVYQSNFKFQELGEWSISNLDDSNDGYFTECAGINLLGGYATFAANTAASLPLTHLPAHTSVTLGFTWAKIDSWDSEYFYINADGSNVYTVSSNGLGNVVDQYCGQSYDGWTEGFVSDSVTFDHTSDELTLEFTSNLSSGGTDESWGLVGITVFVQ